MREERCGRSLWVTDLPNGVSVLSRGGLEDAHRYDTEAEARAWMAAWPKAVADHGLAVHRATERLVLL